MINGDMVMINGDMVVVNRNVMLVNLMAFFLNLIMMMNVDVLLVNLIADCNFFSGHINDVGLVIQGFWSGVFCAVLFG